MRFSKIVIIICISIISINNLFAQNQKDSVNVEYILGAEYRQNDTVLSRAQLMYVLESNEDASSEMNLAQLCRSSAFGLGVFGSVMVGWNIGRYVRGKEPNYFVAGIGAVFIVMAFPLSSASNRHLDNAVKIYNSGLHQTGLRNKDFMLGFTGNGIGLFMCF